MEVALTQSTALASIWSKLLLNASGNESTLCSREIASYVCDAMTMQLLCK